MYILHYIYLFFFYTISKWRAYDVCVYNTLCLEKSLSSARANRTTRFTAGGRVETLLFEILNYIRTRARACVCVTNRSLKYQVRYSITFYTRDKRLYQNVPVGRFCGSFRVPLSAQTAIQDSNFLTYIREWGLRIDDTCPAVIYTNIYVYISQDKLNFSISEIA